jgi:hypothetical protein
VPTSLSLYDVTLSSSFPLLPLDKLMLELSDVDIFALGTRGDMQKMYLADKFMLELFEVHQFALCTW